MGRKLTNKAKAYMVEYQKANVKQIKFTLNYNTDEDMIAYLETVPNKNAYLKDLVRADMKKQKGSE